MKRVLLFAFASMGSGALFCLALPPADYGFLGWIAFVPLLATVRGQGFLTGFCGGLLCMFTTAVLAKTGVFYPVRTDVGTDHWIYTGCFLFGFSVSILSGIWADKGSAYKPLWWFAALAVALESVLLIQLPAHLALTQYRNLFVLFLASLGGIWLSTFAVWFFNLGIAKWMERRDPRLGILWGVLFLGLWVGFYSHKLFGVELLAGVKVGIVQTEASEKGPLLKLQKEAAARGADLVVWPEFAGLGLARGGDTKELQEIANESGAAIVTSFNDDFGPLPHNAASLVTGAAASPFYFKRSLFGGETRMHSPGNKPAVAKFGEKVVGLNICFDSCYPAVIRETANLDQITYVALPTIDPESPHHFIAAVHAAFTPFRAAESGISIIRADGYAHSMGVLSNGQIYTELGAGEGIGITEISPPRGTLYRSLGDWFLYLCYAAVALGVFLFRRPKPQDETEEDRLKAFAAQTLEEARAKEPASREPAPL